MQKFRGFILVLVVSLPLLLFHLTGCSPFVGRNAAVTPNIWPVSEPSHITSQYGMRNHPILKKRIKHAGVDIRAREGTKVFATAPGRVILAGWNNGYGNMVRIDHGDSLVTGYAHLSEAAVKKGEYVAKGDLIGYSGQTGRVTGPHLHYEVKYKGKTVDPKWALP